MNLEWNVLESQGLQIDNAIDIRVVFWPEIPESKIEIHEEAIAESGNIMQVLSTKDVSGTHCGPIKPFDGTPIPDIHFQSSFQIWSPV